MTSGRVRPRIAGPAPRHRNEADMLLQGLKVIELGTYIAGPAAACIMARWGADVTKIEGLTGDPIRWVRPNYRPDIPPNFEIDNHSKRSVAIDISTDEGRALVLDLVRDADVFITSFRVSSLERAGLDYATLSKLNPRLVYGSVSGYGREGAGADQNAFDLTAFWGRSGLATQFFPADAMPSNVRPGIGDHITALTLALGVMTALVERGRTGHGRLVEASLLSSGVYVGSYDIIEQLRVAGIPPAESRASADASAFYRSADDRWFTFYPNRPERDWPAVFTAAGRSDLAQDPRFATAEARGANARDMKIVLDAGFAQQPMAAISETLTANGLTWSIMKLLPEVLDDPYVRDCGVFIDVDDGQGGRLRTPGPPVRFPGADLGVSGEVPTIGQHTDEVLLGLGWSPTAIAELRDARVIR